MVLALASYGWIGLGIIVAILAGPPLLGKLLWRSEPEDKGDQRE